MITVWGRASSSNLQKVTWTLDELGVEYKRHDRGRQFGGTDTEEYLAMNPNGLVPTVKDGDLVMWESHAICRYLARTYNGDGLLPSDPAGVFQVERWMEWNTAHLAPSIFPMFLAAREANDLAVAKEDRFNKTVAMAGKFMSVMDQHLASENYLALGRFTLSDIICSVSLSRWLFIGHNFDDVPNLRAWYDRVGEREACQRHNIASF